MSRRPPPAAASFDPKDFFRTFSYREVVTALCLTLMCGALMGVIFYCNHYDWLQYCKEVLVVICFLGTVILNHVFYKVEHRRPNNYMGRVLADYLLFLFFWISAEVISLIVNGSFASSDSDVGNTVMAVMFALFWTMVVEALLAGIKRILNKFGWPAF